MDEKKIFETKEYGKFKILVGNRVVSPTRVNKIKKSIENVGYITSPILVNEKMEVIDGQGRLQALKQLNLPVEYIIQEGLSIKECVSMNINQTNWNLKDYIKSYADRGIKSYVLLQALMDEYSEIKTVDIFATAIKGTSKFIHKDLKNGEFQLQEELIEGARRRLNYIYDLYKKYSTCTKIQLILQGLIYCTYMQDAEISYDRLKEKVVECLESKSFPTISTIEDVMQYFEVIYNYKSKRDYIYIYTEYRKIIEQKKRIGYPIALVASLKARGVWKENTEENIEKETKENIEEEN